LPLCFHFAALTHGGNSGVEYFEIIPSVKAMTAGLWARLVLFCWLVLIMVTAKARLPQNGIMALSSSNFPIIISQVSTSSIL
jgi:hypothetical protein